MAVAAKHPVANGIAALLCVMLVLFPKGGVRIGTLPVTWGYLLLFFFFVVLMPYRFLAWKTRYVFRQGVAFLCLVPFTLLFFYTYFAFGSTQNGGLVSTATGLLFFPLLFLWFFPPMLPTLDGGRLMKLMTFCVLAAAIFGIVLFFWRPIMGTWLQIPYLTVNADDIADFSNTKNISRGFFFKLISTYNNGNLYGAATFILMGLYDLFTPARWKRWVVRIALILTLSRTVWAGLIFEQLLPLAALLFEQRHRFPRIQFGRIGKFLLVVSFTIPALLVIISLIGLSKPDSFLLDPTLGGRTGQFTHLGSAPFFPDSASSFFFTEIIYLSAVNLYGGIGLPAISCILLSPLVVLLCDQRAIEDPVRRAACKGLLLYALVCTSDGAVNYIPVMAFYWFTYMVFIFGLPGVGAFLRISEPRDPFSKLALPQTERPARPERNMPVHARP